MGQTAAVRTEELVVSASDGARLPARLAEPPGASAAPGLVLAPEVFGLSAWALALPERLAAEGFRTVVVDVLAREPLAPTAPMPELMARMQRLHLPQAGRDLRSAADELRRRGSTRVAAMGFCMGGMVVLQALADDGEGAFECGVDCYGMVRHGKLDPELRPEHPVEAARRIQVPVLGVFGSEDASIPQEQVAELRAALPRCEVAVFPAGHAFLNDLRPERHNAAQAALAWPKILGFLRRQLG